MDPGGHERGPSEGCDTMPAAVFLDRGGRNKPQGQDDHGGSQNDEKHGRRVTRNGAHRGGR